MFFFCYKYFQTNFTLGGRPIKLVVNYNINIYDTILYARVFGSFECTVPDRSKTFKCCTLYTITNFNFCENSYWNIKIARS